MSTKKNKNSAGGKALSSLKGYHALLSARSHGTISKAEFARKSKLLLAKLAKHDKN